MPIVSHSYTSHIPSITGTIERPRISVKLGFESRQRLTIVVAPPGYGKTTLAAQFARGAPYQVAWHTLEKRERDLPNLYKGCVEALHFVVPPIDATVSSAEPAPVELATRFVDIVSDHVENERLLYVLDDVHHLVDAPVAKAWLSSVIDNLPNKMHLVLIGRSLPELPIAEFIARHELTLINQADLKFTQEEIRILAKHFIGSDIEWIMNNEAIQRLEGWAAGITLALQPIQVGLESVIPGGQDNPEVLFEALASRVLDRQSPQLQHFLLCSSTLSHMTMAMCSYVLGLRQAARHLDEIQDRNLFTSSTVHGVTYHSLFRSFLQRRLQREQPDMYTDLHQRVGKWYEHESQWDKAFSHYVAAENMSQAVRVAELVVHSYAMQGLVHIIEEWDRIINGTELKAPKVLLEASIIHLRRYEYADAEYRVNQAARLFADGGDSQGIIDAQLIQASLNMQRGQYEDAIQHATLIASSHEGLYRGAALNTLGFSLLNMGKLDKALMCLEEALSIFRVYGDAINQAVVIQNLEIAYKRLGYFEKANAQLMEGVRLHRSLGKTGDLAMTLNNLGYYSYLFGQYQHALDTFDEAIEIAKVVHDRRAQSYLLWSKGDTARDLGAFEYALELYDQALGLISHSEPYLQCLVLISTAILFRWSGSTIKAEQTASQACELADQYSLPLEKARARAVMLGAKVAEEHSVIALKELKRLISQVERHQDFVELMEILALGASIALANADPAAAGGYLAEAVAIAEHHRIFQPLTAEVAHTPILRDHVVRSPLKYKEVLTQLRQLDTFAVTTLGKSKESFNPHPTIDLRLYTLGDEAILCEGEIVKSSQWETSLSRRLFVYLVFNGPATREQLSAIFWPDVSPRQVRSNFHTCLYRIRSKLGENIIRFENDLYQIDPNINLWCDADQFENLILQARLGSPLSAHTTDMWYKAIDLYQGDFLPSFDEMWVLARRQDIENKYIGALLSIGNAALVQGNLETAMSFFKRAHDIDNLREDIHRQIMICHAQMGNKASVINQLNKLRSLLNEELGVDPSEETLSLINKLLH